MGLDTAQPPPLWLYVFEQYGCDACAEAQPHLARLRAKHPLRVIVIELHVDQRAWEDITGWTPRFTPGYALIDREGSEKKLIKKATGTMTYDQLVDWIGKENLA